MELFQDFIDPVSSALWGYILIYLLLGAGLFFSVCTRFVQLRRFGHLWKLVLSSRAGAEGGILVVGGQEDGRDPDGPPEKRRIKSRFQSNLNCLGREKSNGIDPVLSRTA